MRAFNARITFSVDNLHERYAGEVYSRPIADNFPDPNKLK